MENKMKVKLQGKTKRGSAKVKQHGVIWTIISEVQELEFSPDKGPWLCLKAGSNIRWVHKVNDKDFEVTILEENND